MKNKNRFKYMFLVIIILCMVISVFLIKLQDKKGNNINSSIEKINKQNVVKSKELIELQNENKELKDEKDRIDIVNKELKQKVNINKNKLSKLLKHKE